MRHSRARRGPSRNSGPPPPPPAALVDPAPPTASFLRRQESRGAGPGRPFALREIEGGTGGRRTRGARAGGPAHHRPRLTYPRSYPPVAGALRNSDHPEPVEGPPARVIPVKALTQTLAGLGTPTTNHSHPRLPNTVGTVRNSVRPEPVEGPSRSSGNLPLRHQQPLPAQTPLNVIPAKAGIHRGGALEAVRPEGNRRGNGGPQYPWGRGGAPHHQPPSLPRLPPHPVAGAIRIPDHPEALEGPPARVIPAKALTQTGAGRGTPTPNLRRFPNAVVGAIRESDYPEALEGPSRSSGNLPLRYKQPLPARTTPSSYRLSPVSRGAGPGRPFALREIEACPEALEGSERGTAGPAGQGRGAGPPPPTTDLLALLTRHTPSQGPFAKPFALSLSKPVLRAHEGGLPHSSPPRKQEPTGAPGVALPELPPTLTRAHCPHSPNSTTVTPCSTQPAPTTLPTPTRRASIPSLPSGSKSATGGDWPATLGGCFSREKNFLDL